MHAVVYLGHGRVAHVSDYPEPTLGNDLIAPLKFPRDGQTHRRFRADDLVLLRPVAAGICGTDLHILKGKHDAAPPVVLGHEIAGIVEDVGANVTHVRCGDLVAVDANVNCLVCNECRRGAKNRCRDLTTAGIFFDGGFADLCRVPGRQLIVLPPDLPWERAALFEPTSCVMHGLAQLPRPLGDSALIIGAGPIGLLFLLVLRARGVSTVAVVEPVPQRRTLAGRLSPSRVCHPDMAVAMLGNDAWDLVIDASGHPLAVVSMVTMARPGGQVLLFGQQNAGATVDAFPVTLANQKELIIVGSYATNHEFTETIDVLSRTDVPFERLITHRFALKDYAAAFAAMESAACGKVLLTNRKEVLR